ncbi:uncharacterized protein KY384_006551 [Bacidia gigantensis]|uniref:uncharacterized protein n=1 Tax=Bacidia gigantensis TaxID=2732470 RepID=UPI001D05A1A3|nr:uncharacterized protein KY384_006551 [Bacidia gigantensis]KAG8528862.1 hypothetical protein KY384_006551 [Bacidia gigantensis]
MVKRKLAALEKVDADLTNLQFKIRRDPKSYEGEFADQYGLYQSQKEIFQQAPAAANDTSVTSLKDLIDFVTHVADCYPKQTRDFPQDLLDILRQHHNDLDGELREKIAGSLVLLRRKDIIDSSRLLDTLFPILVSTRSKSLRAFLFQKIISDLRTSNANSTNHRLNRSVQKTLHELLASDRASRKGLWAVRITRELWRRQLWTDAKAVEIMKEAALADNGKLIVGGVSFFLGGDQEREELQDESSDEEAVDMGKIKHQMATNKKNKKNKKMMDQAVATVKRKERKKRQPHPLNFSALHLLHDAQSFAEDLFQKHVQSNKSRLSFEQKLLVLQLISRLVGLHQLTLMNLYSWFLKYLTPRQQSVTSLLASLAQATHSLVPPDVLEPLIQKIANEFVSEAAAGEIASAGLNAIREICVRQPQAMNETLLQDLVMYRKSKDKGVMMAAKGLLSLYREVGADMLKKRDRGKGATMDLKSGERREQRFGEQPVGEIEGLELLQKWKTEEQERWRAEKGLPLLDRSQDVNDEEQEYDTDEWEVEGDNSDDSGGWINVESDKDIELTDSDDETPAVKKAKLDRSGEAEDEDKENRDVKSQDAIEQISNLATSRILTPADLAKLKELRLSASINQHLPKAQRKRAAQVAAALQARHADDALTAAEIEGLASLSAKTSKAEKISKAKEGQDDRKEHKSTQALRKQKKEAEGKSTTNKEKARKKNFLMTLGKGKAKNKRSLMDQRKVLRAHVERGKKGGRRGNRGI